MTDAEEYLLEFSRRAAAAGLELKSPGANWVAMPAIVPGSHISLSVRKDQVQVNLNNQQDADRLIFDQLFAQRAAIGSAVGLPLEWEKKEGRKKTAVRATYPSGLDERASWGKQQQWALETMRLFESVFGRHLRSSRAAKMAKQGRG